MTTDEAIVVSAMGALGLLIMASKHRKEDVYAGVFPMSEADWQALKAEGYAVEE